MTGAEWSRLAVRIEQACAHSPSAKMAQMRAGMGKQEAGGRGQEAGNHMRKQRVFEVFYHCPSDGDVEAVDKVKL